MIMMMMMMAIVYGVSGFFASATKLWVFCCAGAVAAIAHSSLASSSSSVSRTPSAVGREVEMCWLVQPRAPSSVLDGAASGACRAGSETSFACTSLGATPPNHCSQKLCETIRLLPRDQQFVRDHNLLVVLDRRHGVGEESLARARLVLSVEHELKKGS